MKLKLSVILIIMLFIINIIIGGIFITTLNSITIPEVVSNIEIVDVTKDHIIINAVIQIDNKNSFPINANGFIVESTTTDGFNIGEIQIKGGDIRANTKRTFSSQAAFDLNGFDLEPIDTTIHGSVGASFFGIFQKEIPIELQIIVSFDKIINDFDPPQINIHAGISEINENGVQFAGNISVTNPNQYEILLGNISSVITSNTGSVLGHISIQNRTILQNDTTDIEIIAELFYEVLNYKSILINFNANVGAYIGGFNKSIEISTNTEIDVPDINNILLINEVIDFSLSGEFKVKLKGILTTVGLEIYNPTSIPFEVDDLVCRIYIVKNNESILLTEDTMDPCDIFSKEKVCSQTTTIIPYSKLLMSGTLPFLPEWLALGITGDFSIQNTNQTIPISINGYIDPKIFN